MGRRTAFVEENDCREYDGDREEHPYNDGGHLDVVKQMGAVSTRFSSGPQERSNSRLEYTAIGLSISAAFGYTISKIRYCSSCHSGLQCDRLKVALSMACHSERT